MPKVTDLISKFEKLATESEAPDHKGKKISTEAQAKARSSSSQQVSEKPIASHSANKGSGRALPTPPKKGRPLPPTPSKPTAKEQAIIDTASRQNALKEAFMSNPGSTNPILEAFAAHGSPKTFETFKKMMGEFAKDAPANMDEAAYDATARSIFGKAYTDLMPYQQKFVQRHLGITAAEVDATANLVKDILPACETKYLEKYDLDDPLIFKTKQIFTCITDNPLLLFELKESADAKGTDLDTQVNSCIRDAQELNKLEHNPSYQSGQIVLLSDENHLIPHQLSERIYDLSIHNDKILQQLKNIPIASELVDLRLNIHDLESLPPEIGKLPKLRILTINGNQLQQLPDEICELSNLEGLIVNTRTLESLPENIGNLTKLSKLDIANNQFIQSLPDSIINLKNLTTLMFPESFKLEALTPQQRAWLSALKANGCYIRTKLNHNFLPPSF